MRNSSGRLDVFVGIALMIFCAVVPAFAVLGENVSSVTADQARLKASVRMVPHQFYSVQEMRTPSGTTVRQFISPAGMVYCGLMARFCAGYPAVAGHVLRRI